MNTDSNNTVVILNKYRISDILDATNIILEAKGLINPSLDCVVDIVAELSDPNPIYDKAIVVITENLDFFVVRQPNIAFQIFPEYDDDTNAQYIGFRLGNSTIMHTVIISIGSQRIIVETTAY